MAKAEPAITPQRWLTSARAMYPTPRQSGKNRRRWTFAFDRATQIRHCRCPIIQAAITTGDHRYWFPIRIGSGNPPAFTSPRIVGVDRTRDDGFDLLTAEGVFSWVRPGSLVRTQDSSFDSVLDFVFIAGNTWTWEMESEIIERQGDFPDDNQTSDHRPVRADFTIP